MKKQILLLFIFTLCISAFTFGQKHYTIVVGTFLNAQLSDFESIQPYGLVYARELDGDLFQIMLGGFGKHSEAEQIRQQITSKGYVGAFVQERFANEGRLVPVIQIATRPVSQKVEWEQFMQVGELYVLPGKDVNKFVTGIYASMDDAKLALPAVRQLGFQDAFVKQVNTVIMQPVDDFMTGGVEAIKVTQEEPATNVASLTNKNIPPAYDDIPPSYDNQPITQPQQAAFNLPDPGSATFNTPNLHPRVKRTSVLELQKTLQEKGIYTSTLDGLYGNGTASAYEQFKLDNREFQKYLILAEYMEMPDQSTEETTLQNAIDNLLNTPEARAVVERSIHPMGKAYYAYMLFQTIGPGPEVNALMNSAIQESYAGKRLTEAPPFDFTATYAYSNLTQVILHIHYIHSAPGANFSIPCWLFQQHPTETTQAYATYATFSGGDFPLQFCDQFMSWESVKALHAMAVDMNTGNANNQKIAAATSRRAELFLAPQPVTDSEKLILEQWNANLWRNLDEWALRDPMNNRLITTFKTLYYQSYSRFEDYFMDKGFNAEQAKGMAVMTLFTVVGYHMERFV